MAHECHGEYSGGTEQFWERFYRERGRVWSGRANPVLVDFVGSVPPEDRGAALDLGCGEGGDAIWLAEQGWSVTAVDISATAIERAAEQAARAGVADRIDFRRHDLARTLPAGAFDLVSAQYLQSPIEFPRERVLREVASAVAPGGLLLIVTHASAPSWSRAHSHATFPTPEQSLATLGLDLSGWRREFVGAPEREATGPDGQNGIVTDNVIALRRLAR